MIGKALKERTGAFLILSVSPTRDSDFRGSRVRKKGRKGLKKKEKKGWDFRRGKSMEKGEKNMKKASQNHQKNHPKKE